MRGRGKQMEIDRLYRNAPAPYGLDEIAGETGILAKDHTRQFAHVIIARALAVAGRLRGAH